MQSAIPNPELRQNRVLDWLKSNTGLVVVFLILLVFPFIVALLDGQSFSALLANETGNAKFLQGLMIEVFILAVYAISYDLILGITGLLSFGHAMFFAVGAYVTGIALKNLGLGIVPTIGLVMALKGANAREVISGIEARLKELESAFPKGISVSVFYSRSDLVNTAILGVSKSLAEAVDVKPSPA